MCSGYEVLHSSQGVFVGRSVSVVDTRRLDAKNGKLLDLDRFIGLAKVGVALG